MYFLTLILTFLPEENGFANLNYSLSLSEERLSLCELIKVHIITEVIVISLIIFYIIIIILFFIYFF